jgi:hypothetical protein
MLGKHILIALLAPFVSLIVYLVERPQAKSITFTGSCHEDKRDK